MTDYLFVWQLYLPDINVSFLHPCYPCIDNSPSIKIRCNFILMSGFIRKFSSQTLCVCPDIPMEMSTSYVPGFYFTIRLTLRFIRRNWFIMFSFYIKSGDSQIDVLYGVGLASVDFRFVV